MEYTLLECRQKALDNTIVNANGDFETILADQVLIEQGDEIIVSNSFVDTTLLTTSKVSIEEDTVVTFKVGFYNNLYHKRSDNVTDVNEPPQMPFYTLNNANPYATPVQDHYLTQYTHKALDATQKVLQEIYLILPSTTRPRTGLIVGDLTIQLEYLNYAGLPNSLSIYIPPYNSVSFPDGSDTFRITIGADECLVGFDNTYGTNGFKIMGMTDETLSKTFNLKLDYVNFLVVANDTTDHFNLVENTISITIDKGVYDPNELAEIFNDKIDDFNRGFGTTALIMNTTRIPTETLYDNWGYKNGAPQATDIRRVKALLSTTNNLPMTQPYDATDRPTPDKTNGSFAFIATEPSEENEYSGFSTYPNTSRGSPSVPSGTGDANRLFVGTNEFSMEYDSSTGRYRFTFLHMPLYLASNPICLVAPLFINNSVAPFIPTNDTDTPATFKYVAHNSGVFFTQMSPQSFWKDKLGLDLKTILHTPVQIIAPHYFTGSIGQNAPTPWDIPVIIPAAQFRNGKIISLTAGTNTTDGLIAYDTAVIKPAISDDNASQNVFYPYYEQVFDAGSPNKVLIGTQTEFIDGANQVINSIISSGYYLLEIHSKFNSTLITSKNTSRSILQIINRYYSINTYTAQEGSDMVYTHKGEGVYLSSLKIRILNPDQSLARVGDDNTVFIKIVKAPKDIKNSSNKK
mgnify:CR=1 FL=1|tara:strand:+ start:1636 stop:3696 length:2061 start_codon:yes stop_codon:yes gene_type:complete